jgi:uncharacterized lipoprotein YmbA
MTFARLPRPPRGFLRGAACVGALAGLLAMGACSSPSSRFYTLGADGAGAGAAGSGSPGSAAPVSARTGTAPAWLIEVAPIDVPPQVAKNQLVVQSGPTQVRVLEQERWASLPGDEIRRALSTDLTQQLGTIDVYGTAYPDTTAVYRVSMNVQRFESWPGSHALIDAVWSVRAVRSAAVMTCRSVVSVPVSGGFDALVDGHRAALRQVALQVATAVRGMAAVSGSARSGSAGKVVGVAVPVCPSADAGGVASAGS